MKGTDTQKMSNEELREEVARLRKQLFELRSQAVTEKLENPRQIRKLRRDVARILTEKRQRQIRSDGNDQ